MEGCLCEGDGGPDIQYLKEILKVQAGGRGGIRDQ